MKKAFTLIELLVVIAIIAILAAILFPVFAQAKAAAKGAASISNLKQMATSAIMYTADADDLAVPGAGHRNSDPDAIGAGGTNPIAMWALLIDPYSKNVDIYSSPLGNPSTTGNEIKRRTGTRFMSYGYNYSYLNPSPVSNPVVTPAFASMTSFARPAETVIFAEHVSRGNRTDPAAWWMGPGTMLNIGNAETPACYFDPYIWCMDGWGNDGISANGISKVDEGKYTGTNAPRKSGQIPVAWVDGHVKSMAPGNLATGTNWTKSATGMPNGNIVINDYDKYLWDDK